MAGEQSYTRRLSTAPSEVRGTSSAASVPFHALGRAAGELGNKESSSQRLGGILRPGTALPCR